MVLLLLALGSLLLQGLNQQQRSLLAQVSAETQAIRDTAAAQSALQWGKGVNWPLQSAVACQQENSQRWRACLRLFNDDRALLIAGSGTIQLWQSASIEQGKLRYLAHGWSDFCPLKENALCLMP